MRIFKVLKKKQYIIGLVVISMNLFILNSYLSNFDSIIGDPAKKKFILGISGIMIYYFACLFLESEFDSIFFKVLQIKIEKIVSFSSIFALFFVTLSMLFGVLFYSTEYVYYYKYCPYVLSGMDYKLHFKRRCELYNIDKENIYPFQYICSYNEKNFFTEKFVNRYFPEIPSEFECSKVTKLINNNKVIDEFINEYYKEDLYYCNFKSKIGRFQKSIAIKECDDKILPLVVFVLLDIIFSVQFIYFIYSYFKDIKANIQVGPNYAHLKVD